ncbi:hypothetical protein, partial [Flavobacterium sp. SaA2.13]|uniref:hypothetical protein n=1 Tax=Flavobacterium sp. SaA2.13 TaxID=2691898 RepID=UPI001CEF840B
AFGAVPFSAPSLPSTAMGKLVAAVKVCLLSELSDTDQEDFFAAIQAFTTAQRFTRALPGKDGSQLNDPTREPWAASQPTGAVSA